MNGAESESVERGPRGRAGTDGRCVSSSRRKLLKTGAVVAGLGVIPTTTSAKQDFDDVYRQALKIRDRTGDNQKFTTYLAAHGYKVQTETRDFAVPSSSGNDISIQKLNKSSLSTTLCLAYSGCSAGSYAYADYYFSIDTGIFDDGKAGPDEITLSWNDDHYRIVDYSWYTKSNTPNLNYRASELNGVNWEWGDGSACWSGCSHDLYVGCKMKLLSTSQERAVRAEYRHTWDGAKFGGFGVSSGGAVVFSVAPTTNYWEGGYETRDDSDMYCS